MQQDFIHNQNGKVNGFSVTSKTAHESQKAYCHFMIFHLNAEEYFIVLTKQFSNMLLSLWGDQCTRTRASFFMALIGLLPHYCKHIHSRSFKDL